MPEGKYVRRNVYLRPRVAAMLDYLLAEQGKPKAFSALISRLIRAEHRRAEQRAAYQKTKDRPPPDRT